MATSSTTGPPGPESALENDTGSGPGDVLNDVLPTSVARLSKPQEDSDTCRICRGEGTPEEPLFHPCKCSGSIKFVHQDCLMEWLSHSQKKHCELCKTPFRFTKLYHPHMPQTLPTLLFLRRATLHVINALLNWCRGILVISVWSIWLPWCMRFVWSGLFWLGDGGWLQELGHLKHTHDDLIAERARLQQTLNTSAVVSKFSLSRFIMPPSLMNGMLHLLGLHNSTSETPQLAANTTMTNATAATGSKPHRGSLLSGWSVLQDPTPSSSVNKFILDTTEGQVITLAVVTAFILVFLIREWVVQQQPALNLGGLQEEVDIHRRGEVAPPADQDAAQQQAHDIIVGDPDITAASLAAQSDLDAEEDLLVTTDTIRDLIAELRELSAPLEFMTRPDFALWEGGPEELRRANEVTSKTRRLYRKVRAQSKQALFSRRTAEAREALDHLGQLKEALTCLPWSDDKELEEIVGGLQEYMDTAYQLIALQEELSSQRTELSGLQEFNTTRNIATLPDALVGDDARRRPSMPERSRSSMAASIRRQLEEPEEQQEQEHEQEQEQAQSSSDESGNQEDGLPIANESWSFVGISESTEVDTASDGPNDASSMAATTSTQFGLDAPPGESSPTTEQMDSALEQTFREASEGSGQDSDELLGAELRAMVARHTHPDDNHSSQSSGRHDEALEPRAQQSFRERTLDWMFRDIAPGNQAINDDPAAEHVVNDVAAEAPFARFHNNQPDPHHDGDDDDDEGAAPVDDALAAAQAANVAQDAEAVEEAEDIEGILELIGMQGPLAGLFQNAVFAAVLIAATIATAILAPYLWGKLVFILAANPINAVNLPLRVVSTTSNVLIDVGIFCAGMTAAWTHNLLRWLKAGIPVLAPRLGKYINRVDYSKLFERWADAALVRIANNILKVNDQTSPMTFAVDALACLRWLQALAREYGSDTRDNILSATHLVRALHTASRTEIARYLTIMMQAVAAFLLREAKQIKNILMALPGVLQSGQLPLPTMSQHSSLPSAFLNDRWSISDRITAILTGYGFYAMVGYLYVQRGTPFSTSENGRKIEGIIRDTCVQSAGVLKVILIIGIEMLAFPLYCGFLLDTAMLPLFGEARAANTLPFSNFSIYTSIFFHWFIGTCYMFHFALFVAMCRRIFRKGVLYFIRDPDDPHFHPVRDVLERSVSSQLRKIGFSALVYGALVILCMGSVVWAVAYTVSGIFPIKLTAKDSYLGYPVDLLMYNILAPLAIRFLRPSKGLQRVYEWWFRRAARLLRLSHFLFNDVRDDENKHSAADDGASRYGSFVRAPASDHVRVPRGRKVFLEVDQDNNRLDGQPEPRARDEAHSPHNEKYSKVWIPPWFKFRIGVFVFLMWLLTALLGLSATVLPLMMGRKVMSLITTSPTNDLYSYFIGAAPLLVLIYAQPAVVRSWTVVRTNLQVRTGAIAHIVLRAFSITYTYTAFTIYIPTLLACIMECYLILPLQDYSSLASRPATPHVIYLLQDWALGLMYMRIMLRLLIWNGETRLARATRAIVARGWLHPDVGVTTRCFVLPITLITAVAIGAPAGLAYLGGRLLPYALSFRNELMELEAAFESRPSSPITELSPDQVSAIRVHILRFSYPLVLAVIMTVWSTWMLKAAASKWRMRIRDEIYLIGERLHNFGEGKPGPAASSSTAAVADMGDSGDYAAAEEALTMGANAASGETVA